MNHMNSVIDVPARQISIRKKLLVFKTSFHKRVKAHNTMNIGIKFSLPLRNGDFIAKAFRPFSNYLPLNFMLQIPDIVHSHTYHNLYNHTPQSHNYPTYVESLHMSKHCHHHEY